MKQAWKLRKTRSCLLCALCALLCLLSAGCANSAATTDRRTELSPALDVLRGQTELVRCTTLYDDLSFSTADFVSLTGESTRYIVVNTLPAAESGLLLLNGSAVLAGQTVPVASLNYLKFVPAAASEAEATFTFTAGADGWESNAITCRIALLEGENYPPVSSDVSANTFAEVACTLQLRASDPNGDSVTFSVTSYPRHGTLRLDGGAAVYCPLEGYTGEDSFTFVAKDRYGATSSEGTVTLQVEKNPSGLFFADLVNEEVHNTAIRLCAQNYMTYRMENGKYYFDPSEEVSKIDCLIMMMCLCGQSETVTAVADTAAADDTTLSAGKKGFLQAAIAVGAVHLENGNFAPDEAVTAADAAYMATALLHMPTLSPKQEFSDLDVTPTWACTALVSADASGILSAVDGLLAADAHLTRADVARMLENMLSYRNPA